MCHKQGHSPILMREILQLRFPSSHDTLSLYQVDTWSNSNIFKQVSQTAQHMGLRLQTYRLSQALLELRGMQTACDDRPGPAGLGSFHLVKNRLTVPCFSTKNSSGIITFKFYVLVYKIASFLWPFHALLSFGWPPGLSPDVYIFIDKCLQVLLKRNKSLHEY